MANDIQKIVKLIKDRRFEPVVVFSFNRRECEQYATSLRSLDLCTDEEREVIDAVRALAVPQVFVLLLPGVPYAQCTPPFADQSSLLARICLRQITVWHPRKAHDLHSASL
jgi:superfamily II RNA helicase